MATTVRLTVLTGPHKKRRFCFQGPMHCTVGRANDCSIRLSGDERDYAVSRHHCQLDIDPPCVRIQDLGSLNGTYVNGRKLEPDEAKLTTAAAALVRKLSVAESVGSGDIITVGDTSFQINLMNCPLDAPKTGTNSSPQQEEATAKVDCPISC